MFWMLYILCEFGPEWGKGFQVAGCATKSCCHLLAQGANLHSARRTKPVSTPQASPCLQWKPAAALAFQPLGREPVH